MKPPDLYQQYSEVGEALETYGDAQDSRPFVEAVSRLRSIAEAGCVEAAAALAEIYALPGPHHQPDEAYKWYFIALSAEGYSTEFHSEQAEPQYLGRVGDFRNEAMVNSLVAELGFERARELDREATAWLHDHRVFFTDPRDDRTPR